MLTWFLQIKLVCLPLACLAKKNNLLGKIVYLILPTLSVVNFNFIH